MVVVVVVVVGAVVVVVVVGVPAHENLEWASARCAKVQSCAD